MIDLRNFGTNLRVWATLSVFALACVCDFWLNRSRMLLYISARVTPPTRRKSFNRLPKRQRYKTNDSPAKSRCHGGASLLWDFLPTRTCLRTGGYFFFLFLQTASLKSNGWGRDSGSQDKGDLNCPYFIMWRYKPNCLCKRVNIWEIGLWMSLRDRSAPFSRMLLFW